MSTQERLANRHFLVVDDEEFVRTLVARYLRRSGAAGVVEAADGREAIAAIASYDMAFDAIVTDINMRPMNGIELLRAIRLGSGGLKRNTPVLVLTAHSEAEHVAEAFALDADAFVVKPVEREALVDRILRVLGRTLTIQPAAHYAAFGALDESATAAPALEHAPPTKPLLVSVESVFTAMTEDEGMTHAARPPLSPLTAARKVALAEVKANSILAQDIYIVDTPRLLLAAPSILTQSMLDRLKDLRQIHDCYSHVFVIAPAA
jgi:CheY-like chemotaxis protein